MIETPWTVRQATPADAGDIAQLMNDLNRYEGLESIYSEALVRRDGFGENAAYHVLKRFAFDLNRWGFPRGAFCDSPCMEVGHGQTLFE